MIGYQATLAKLDGIRMGAIDGLNLRFTLNGVDYVCYNNVYLMDQATMEQFKEKWVPGGKANIRGIVNVFGGVYQIYPNSLDCLEIVTETDAEKVAGFKGVLELEDKYSRNFTLPSSTYVNVAWTVTGEGATIGKDGYSVTLSQLDDQSQEVTFTATITSGQASDTYTKKVTITKKLAAFENKVEGADIKTFKELKKAAPTKKGEETTDKYYTIGYISKIDNATYGNVYIVDESGNEFYVYGLYNYNGKVRYDKMDASVKPQVDDLVVVYGILSFYNSAQMKNARLLQLNDKVLLPSDEEVVTADAAAIEQAGLEASYYQDFTLTVTGAEGSTIVWASNNDKVTIDNTTGKVSFADLEADATVTFTGTVTKGSSTKKVTLTTKLIASNTEYTVNYSAGENGSIAVKNSDAVVATGSKVKVGTVIKVTVTPAEGYQLASYTLNGGDAVAANGETSFDVTVTDDVTIVVTFELIPTGPETLTSANFAGKAKDEFVSVDGWTLNVAKGCYDAVGGVFHSSFRKDKESVTSNTFKAQNSVDVTFHWYLNNKSTSGNMSSKLKFEGLDASGKVVATYTSEELNGTTVQKPADMKVTLTGEGIVQVKITFVKSGGGNIGFSTITIATTVA